jgi:hypothetical protein
VRHTARADHLDVVGHCTLAGGGTADWLPSGASLTPETLKATWEPSPRQSPAAASQFETPGHRPDLTTCSLVPWPPGLPDAGSPCDTAPTARAQADSLQMRASFIDVGFSTKTRERIPGCADEIA